VDHMPGHSAHHPPQEHAATDPPGPHGMAVIGEQSVYLSHLPMFMALHAFQVLLDVRFEGDGDPQAVYLRDRMEHPQQRLYTFNPVPFVLPSLFSVGENPPTATSFRGSLHRGHFERPNTNPVRIAADVTVQVRKVLHQHKFQSGAAELEELQYFLFGEGSETFLAHHITRPPDFDQLVSVGLDVLLSDEDLSKGAVVKFADRPNTVADRIRPGVDPELAAVVELDGSSRPIRVRPKVEFYFEAGELAEAM
jgi:hypothetical protein